MRKSIKNPRGAAVINSRHMLPDESEKLTRVAYAYRCVSHGFEYCWKKRGKVSPRVSLRPSGRRDVLLIFHDALKPAGSAWLRTRLSSPGSENLHKLHLLIFLFVLTLTFRAFKNFEKACVISPFEIGKKLLVTGFFFISDRRGAFLKTVYQQK